MIAKSGKAAVLGACALIAVVALGSSPRRAAGADSAPLNRSLPPSNSALLLSALRGASAKLARQAPVTPGSRIVIETDGEGVLALDARQALLEAFTGRKIEVVLVNVAEEAPPPSPAAVDTAQARAQSNTITAPMPTGDFAGGSLNNTFTDLQRERMEQAARAESLSRAAQQPGSAPAGTAPRPASRPSSVLTAPGDLPRLAVRVEEARVDYVRQYRGGLLGAYRVERRATARLDVRLASAGSDAVTWTASADSSLGDVVLRSDLPSLESKMRPETMGTLPQAGFKKVLEPILVIVLVAGLVSLFYQNRP